MAGYPQIQVCKACGAIPKSHAAKVVHVCASTEKPTEASDFAVSERERERVSIISICKNY